MLIRDHNEHISKCQIHKVTLQKVKISQEFSTVKCFNRFLDGEPEKLRATLWQRHSTDVKPIFTLSRNSTNENPNLF